MDKTWILKENQDPKKIESLCKSINVSPLVAKLLLDRGIENYDQAKAFFRPSLDDLHNPFLMKDMDKAVARINEAINGGEGILIYGDYDVDGTTSVSLMTAFLKDHYDHLLTYIPDRYVEGYGVSKQGVDFADKHGVSLIIALDCGVKALDKVDYARSRGIDFIICDHHRPGAKLPNAVAVLDPKRNDCEYPYKELSGCGVGFKLVQALCLDWNLGQDSWYPLLDLLALSIGADIVPITGENRILAYHGLKLLNHLARPGMEQLIALSGKKKPFTITDVVFTIGPRINAAGRMDHGHKAVELLSSTDAIEVEKLARNINENNNARRKVEAEILNSAIQQIKEEKLEDKKTTVLYNAEWNKGVIGIVASKLIEKHYYRPTIIFTQSKGMLAASARSVQGFDIYQALESCEDILEQFGGHMYAAGMTLKPERFEAFRERFEQVVSDTIEPQMLKPRIEVDAELSLEEINSKTFNILKQFEPFGPGNLQPIFATKNVEDSGYAKQVGADKSHLKFQVINPKDHTKIGGIGFGFGDQLELISGNPFNLCYHIDENEWQGIKSLQLRALDLKPGLI